MGARRPLRLFTGICCSFLEEATLNGIAQPFDLGTMEAAWIHLLHI